MKPINIDKPIEFILPEEKESKKPTRWLFKILTIEEEETIQDWLTNQPTDNRGYLQLCHKALSIGLLGAENFDGGKWVRDSAGEDIISGVKMWSSATLCQIPRSARLALGSFVLSSYSRTLEEEEAKN